MKKYKIIKIISIIILLNNTVFAQYPCMDPQVFFAGTDLCPDHNIPYKLVFHDNFKSNSIDNSKWYTYYPYGPDPNDGSDPVCRTKVGELENYKDNNVILNSGILSLVAKEELNTTNGFTKNYTSGMINSKQKFITYTKYEVRCKVPSGQGFWPAFWAFGWTTELDPLDNFGAQNELKLAVHKWTSICPGCIDGRISNAATINVGDQSQAFHTYAVEYEKFFINFYYDGNLIYKVSRYIDINLNPVTSCSVAPGTYLQERSFPWHGDHLEVIANLAIGGTAGSPNLSTVFPQSFDIDYIRVYQRDIQPGLTDLCLNRSFSGDNNICINDIKTYNLTGEYGDLNISVSSNLEILSSSELSVTIKPKPNTNGQVGHLYINETNSPCTTNFSIDKIIEIGTPPDPVITSFGCGNSFSSFGYSIESPYPFLFSWDNNPLSSMPILAGGGGGLGGNNSPSIIGNLCSFTPTINDKVCIPYTYSSTNNCGTTTKSGFIYNHCYPSNVLAKKICERVEAMIDLSDFANHLNIFPIPTTNNFNINLSDGYNGFITECQVYNQITNNLVYSNLEIAPTTNIDCSNWESGNYVVILKLETGQNLAKLISKL